MALVIIFTSVSRAIISTISIIGKINIISSISSINGINIVTIILHTTGITIVNVITMPLLFLWSLRFLLGLLLLLLLQYC